MCGGKVDPVIMQRCAISHSGDHFNTADKGVTRASGWALKLDKSRADKGHVFNYWNRLEGGGLSVTSGL